MAYCCKKTRLLNKAENLAYLLRDDLTIAAIAEHFEVSMQSVSNWRKEIKSGVLARKPRAGPVPSPVGKLDFASKQSIALGTNSSVQAARVYGVTRQRVSQIRGHALREPEFYGLTAEQVEAAQQARAAYTFPVTR